MGDVVRARLFPSLAPRPRVAHFTLLERLGEGGMGSVWRARDERLDRDVAIKLVRDHTPSPRAHARLIREAKALARVGHPNIVPVFEVGEHAGEVFIAMELIDGTTMREWVVGRGWREVVAAYCDAAAGLSAAHEAGLVHRDFKPDNVLVDARGHVRVADFGIAVARGAGRAGAPARTQEHAKPADATATGSVAGTPSYMAPEQRGGEAASPASDQYSFCVSLWEALHGTRPDEAPSTGRSPVPRRVDRVLRRGLAPDPAQRFADVDALRESLSRATTRPAARWAGVAVLAAAAAVGAAASRPSQEEPPEATGAPVESPCPAPTDADWVWRSEGDFPVAIAPVHEGRLAVIAGTAAGPRLVTLDAQTGAELSSVPLAEPSPPLVIESAELFLERAADGGIFALQVETGDPAFHDARLVRLSPKGGMQWETPIAPATATGATLVADRRGGVLLIVHDYHRRADVVHRVDATGEVQWTYAAPRGRRRMSPAEAVSVFGDTVLVAGVVSRGDEWRAEIRSLDLATGADRGTEARVLDASDRRWPLGIHARADGDAFVVGLSDRGSSTFVSRVDEHGAWRWIEDLEPAGRTSPRAAEYLHFRGANSGACMSYLAAPVEAVEGDNFTVVWCVDSGGQCMLSARGDTPRYGGDLQRDEHGAAYVAWREGDAVTVRKYSP